MLLLSALSAPALGCVIEAADFSWRNVPVVLPDERFLVSLEHVDVLATPGDPSEVVVTRPLMFTTHQDRLPVHTREPLSLYGGVLSLPTELYLELDPTRASETHIQARLPARELKADDLAVPCDALTLIDRQHPGAPQLIEPQDRRNEVYLHGPTPFRRARFHSDPWVVDVDGPLHVELRRPGWLQLAARWDDGTEVRGWVESKDTYRPMFRTRRGYGHIGGMGMGACGRSHGPPLFQRTVEVGTAIHADPGGVAWATYTEPVEVLVFEDSEDGWVRIGHTPGLVSPPCSEHDRLWVREERLHRDISAR